MTCIVGYAENGNVWMGADSASASGYDISRRATPKLFTVRPGLLIGFTSSWRMGQILETASEVGNLEPPDESFDPHISRVQAWKWMVTKFVPAAREALKGGGYTEVKDNRESSGEFLVAMQKYLFNVSSDFQVTAPAQSYDAVGSGAAVALGAMYVLSSFSMKPERRIELALMAAQEYNAGVREPFTVWDLRTVTGKNMGRVIPGKTRLLRG